MRDMTAQGQPFVLATVVRVERPTSSKPGAKAIISQDGTLTGWIGGSCTEPVVIREAGKALEDGNPRLLRLYPPEKMGQSPQEGVTEVPLTCVSGGTLEIYLEPYLSQPRLLVIGHQAVAEALVAFGKELGYVVSIVGENLSGERFHSADHVIGNLDFANPDSRNQLEFTPNTYVVVTSHGNYDELALEAALTSDAPYIALVASKKRAEAVRLYLQQDGIPEEQIARIKCPAGLDLGAITPQEIALTILAEIIQVYRKRHSLRTTEGNVTDEVPAMAVDPVCGMQVEISSARYTAVYEGKIIYFCSAHCQHLFEKKPQDYIQKEDLEMQK